MAGLTGPALVLLAVAGLVGGVGISAIGPGGVLVTIALVALTPLSPAQVAGTAVVTHVATGSLAAAAYTRSGHLRERATRRNALLLAGAALAGTPLGVAVNSVISGRDFELALAAFVAGVALLVWRRNARAGGARAAPDAGSGLAVSPAAPATARPGPWAVAGLGFGVAVVSGMFGVGGPLLAVPLLVVFGAPVLSALAAAAVQSAVIASVATLGYLAQGDIDWVLAGLVGVPELAGVLVGWVLARALPVPALTRALVAALLALAVYLAVRG